MKDKLLRQTWEFWRHKSINISAIAARATVSALAKPKSFQGWDLCDSLLLGASRN